MSGLEIGLGKILLGKVLPIIPGVLLKHWYPAEKVQRQFEVVPRTIEPVALHASSQPPVAFIAFTIENRGALNVESETMKGHISLGGNVVLGFESSQRRELPAYSPSEPIIIRVDLTGGQVKTIQTLAQSTKRG